MAYSTLYKISKALVGSPKPAKSKTAKYESIRIDNVFKTRDDLVNLTDAEKQACKIFSQFNGSVPNAMPVKEESLPLTTYANCLRTLRLELERDPSPVQMVSVLWGKMTIAHTTRAFKSECTNFNYYRYSPNHEHEKVLIFAGLMVVIMLSYPEKDQIEDIINAIRTSAHSKENLDYFRPFDKAIKTFNPNEVSLYLNDAINAIKAATKPYKALALYEFLCNQFSNDEATINYLKQECASVPMSEPEIGAHIENVNVTDGGAMNMFDNSTVHNELKALPSTDPQKLISDEHQ